MNVPVPALKSARMAAALSMPKKLVLALSSAVLLLACNEDTNPITGTTGLDSLSHSARQDTVVVDVRPDSVVVNVKPDSVVVNVGSDSIVVNVGGALVMPGVEPDG